MLFLLLLECPSQTFHNRNLLVPVVVIIEGIILLEHVTLNLKLRFASNMYQICSMHVQVLSASPAVKGIPAQHFPNLPRKRREWNDDYCMSCIFSSLLTNWKCSLNSVNAGISIRLRRFSSKRSIAAWVFLSSRVVGFACYMNSHFAVVADQNVEWYSHLHKYENHSPTTAPLSVWGMPPPHLIAAVKRRSSGMLQSGNLGQMAGAEEYLHCHFLYLVFICI